MRVLPLFKLVMTFFRTHYRRLCRLVKSQRRFGSSVLAFSWCDAFLSMINSAFCWSRALIKNIILYAEPTHLPTFWLMGISVSLIYLTLKRDIRDKYGFGTFPFISYFFYISLVPKKQVRNLDSLFIYIFWNITVSLYPFLVSFCGFIDRSLELEFFIKLIAVIHWPITLVLLDPVFFF